MKYQKPKFKVGDEVIICQDLITTITEVTDEPDGHHIYWFNSERGRQWETEHAIELLSNCRIQKKCDHENSYHFHNNAPAYCPECDSYVDGDNVIKANRNI